MDLLGQKISDKNHRITSGIAKYIRWWIFTCNDLASISNIVSKENKNRLNDENP
jgi:hypothetical protein